jgi:hypothetical protein
MTGLAKLTKVVGLTILTLAGAGCSQNTGVRHPRGLTPELPITRVTLYQNGIAYFEREGRLQGDRLTLHCRPHQINDLLKSLTVIDRTSGRAVSISLPLEKGVVARLGRLPKQVRNTSGLLDVLRVFRGARIRIRGRQGTVSGRVVGVERGLLRTTGKTPPTGWRVTLKSDGGQLVVYPVAEIKRLQMLDRALELGLDKSLDISLEQGTWKPIRLSVRLAGARNHDLLVSYIVEMPNWKPAYRLVLGTDGRPLLQGWAVVDNLSGESWSKVRLSLVAGTPMSFLYNLHSPRFTRRIDLSHRGRAVSLAPPPGAVGYRRGLKDRLQRSYRFKRGSAGKSRAAPSARRPMTLRKERSRGDLARDLEKAVRRSATGQKMGSLFRYDLRDRVTVPDSTSTLVNIVNARVPGKEVVLFRPELTNRYTASHPYRAVHLTNTSGFSLEKGPVAIYARRTFMGEAFLERLNKNQTIFLTYAIDPHISMTRREDYSSAPVRLLKIHGGMVVSEVMRIYKARYTITNRHEKPITAYVKSVRRSGYKLRTKAKGIVRGGNAIYAPIKVAPGATRVLTVEWVSPVQRRLAINTSLAMTVLKMYIGTGKVPAQIKVVLDKIMGARTRINNLNAEIGRIWRVRRTLTADQKRVRANLKLLRKVRGNARLKKSLLKSLGKLESKLSQLTARYVKLDEQRAGLRAKMRIWIGQITLDATR